MVAERIRNMQAEKEDVLERFSRGELGRLQAMRKLDMSYSELLDHLAKKGLDLPRVPRDEAERMGRDLNELLNGLHQ